MKTFSLAIDAATLLCLVGCGLVAGVLFIFSVCIMKVLGAQPPAQGIAAMQSINVVIINPWFMTAFLGTVVLCVGLTIASLLQWNGTSSVLVITGSGAYVVGTFLVTMLFNVPRNDALAAVRPDTIEAARVWADYLVTWTAWNHARVAAAVAATALFGVALWAKS
jgi:uncharacterized membrane protein